MAAAAQASRRTGLGLCPTLVLLLLLGPVTAGLVGTLLPAFGHLPVVGAFGPSLEPWRRLLADPALGSAVAVSVLSGTLATLLAVVLALGTVAAADLQPRFGWLRRAMLPVLAVPHAAAAVGLAFLLAPSGWLARLVSPWPSGWEHPPDWATVQDPYGLALTLGLVVKETPFLVLMAWAARAELGGERQLAQARTLGYAPAAAWCRIVLPRLYARIRLPIFAVLAFGLSVVDMALILGPSAPPTLAALVLRWSTDPDLQTRLVAAAGACLQVGLVGAAVGVWLAAERLVARSARPWLTAGQRSRPSSAALTAVWFCAAVATVLGLAGLAVLGLWSMTGSWRFPDALPRSFSTAAWASAAVGWLHLALTSLAIAAAATSIAVALAIGCLERERRLGSRPGNWTTLALYLPLVLPQIGFLFGWQVVLVAADLDGSFAAVVLTHLVFVLPYVFIALAGPYRALDPRYAQVARALGKAPWIAWLTVTLPLLARPLLVAVAVGLAVSVAQYLPTVFAGAGRWPTLATETVTLAAGADRRELAVVALVLSLLPLVAFASALELPAQFGWRLAERRRLA